MLRLLLPQVPEYQDDIRAWASAATGYDIRFRRISASWPLSGPELSFYDVSLTRPGETEAVLTAREMSAGLSVWRTAARLASRHSAMSLSAARRIAIERTPDGDFRVQGRRLEDLLPKLPRDPRPEIDLDLQDIAITYPRPAARAETGGIRARTPQGVARPGRLMAADATLALPERLRAALSSSMSSCRCRCHRRWRCRPRGTRDCPEPASICRSCLHFAVGDTGPLRAAAGDATLELRIRDRRPPRVAADVALHDVAVGAPERTTAYQRLGGRPGVDPQRRRLGRELERPAIAARRA